MLPHLSDDLATHCLSFLAAHDLAQCTAASWALRRLAADDALWRPHSLRLPGSPSLVVPAMPARLLYAAVGLLTSARLQAASAEKLRTREKETYNRHRFAAHQMRQTLQHLEVAREKQRAAEAAQQRLLAAEAVASMEVAGARRPHGWALHRPASPPTAASHAAAAAHLDAAAGSVRGCAAKSAQEKQTLRDLEARSRELQQERRECEAREQQLLLALGSPEPWHALLEPALPPSTQRGSNPPPPKSRTGLIEGLRAN